MWAAAILLMLLTAAVIWVICLRAYTMKGILVCPGEDGRVTRINFETCQIQTISAEEYCSAFNKEITEIQKDGEQNTVVLYSGDGKKVLYEDL